jgi:hypothetical protein
MGSAETPSQAKSSVAQNSPSYKLVVFIYIHLLLTKRECAGGAIHVPSSGFCLNLRIFSRQLFFFTAYAALLSVVKNCTIASIFWQAHWQRGADFE